MQNQEINQHRLYRRQTHIRATRTTKKEELKGENAEKHEKFKCRAVMETRPCEIGMEWEDDLCRNAASPKASIIIAPGGQLHEGVLPQTGGTNRPCAPAEHNNHVSQSTYDLCRQEYLPGAS